MRMLSQTVLRDVYWKLALASAPMYEISVDGLKVSKQTRFEHYFSLIQQLNSQIGDLLEDNPSLGFASVKVETSVIQKDYVNANLRNLGLRPKHGEDAVVELTGPNGTRRVPIKDFYLKAKVVDIRDGEIQTAILIPKASYENTYGYYIKYAMRNALDIATNGCSVNVRLSADKKTFGRVRVAYGVAGPIPSAWRRP